MARERISDDYEDFEPEVRIWPYIALAFLLQTLPVSLTILLGGGFSLPLVLRAFYGLLPLFFTASIMREGEKPWKLVIAGLFYGALELVIFVLASVNGADGYALGIPFGLDFSPVLLSLSAYVFFLKRRHGKWLGTVLVSYLLEVAIFFFLARYAEGPVWMLYPTLLVVLTTFNLFVTRRTDGTPWFITIVLALLVVASATFSPAFSALFLGDDAFSNPAEVILGVFAFSQHFWYTLSFLFVFSGLAAKSSYRRIYEDDVPVADTDASAQTYEDHTEEEEPRRPAYSFPMGEDPRYAYPPEYNRREEEPQKEESRQERKAAEPRVETPKSPSYEEQVRSSSTNHDKWYEFISGGVKDDVTENRQSSRDREYRDDRYYEERDRRSYYDGRDADYRRDDRRNSRYDDREREQYRRNLYDDRDHYYEDRRRDDRYYDDRRDDRYYRERDRREYDERRDYRDRRDYPRDSRRYEDEYDQRSRRYDDDRDRS